MLRVLVLINNTGIGGTERRLGRLFARMAAEEKDTVFVINQDLWDRLVKAEIVSASGVGVKRLPVPFTRLAQWVEPLSESVGFWVRKLDYVLFACWFTARYGCSKQRTFHAVLGGIYFVLPLMLLRTNHRFVLSVTDPNLAGHVGSRLTIPLFTAAMKRSHCIDALTDDIRASLVGIGLAPHKIIVSPGSVVDVQRFVPAGLKQPWVVFAGRLVEEKNPLLFVEAIPFILDRVPQARFFLLGTGPLRRPVQEAIGRLHVEGAVTVEFRDDIAPILAKARVFVSLQKRDNYPSQVLLEAMASGMATVATDVGHTAKLVDIETGLRVTASARAIADAVVTLLCDPELCDRLGKQARGRVIDLHSEEQYWAYIQELRKRVDALPCR